MKSFQVHYQVAFFKYSFHSVTTNIIQSRHGLTQSAFEELTSQSLNPRISVL